MRISQIIDDALVELGVKNPIDEASPQEHEFGLRTLNRIIDGLNARGLAVHYSQLIEFAPPEQGWKRRMIIGDGEYLNIPTAPNDILNLYFRKDNNDYIVRKSTWQLLSRQSYKGAEGVPSKYAVQYLGDKMELMFNVIPSSEYNMLIEGTFPYTGSDIDGKSFTPSDDINWGYGIENYLVSKLALELAPSYGVGISAITLEKVKEGERLLKRRNFKPRIVHNGYKRRWKWDNLARY